MDERPSPEPTLDGGFRLGEFQVRPSLGTVLRGNEVVARLEPKVMSVLVHLAGHPGEVVAKETLLAAVWPGTAVEEVALARSVSELRRVFGDDARRPWLIETLHRRGYRLLPTVEGLSARQAPAHRIKHRRVVSGLLIGAAVASIGLWRYARAPGPPTAASPTARTPARIVVLPFENLGTPEDSFFAAGMTEEITSRLASVRGLAVISRTSSLQYADTTKTIPQIAEELDVDFVLEGSVRWDRTRPEASRVRITPQLIRTRDDTHLWSQVYDRDFGQIFALQAELAGEVIRQVDSNLVGRGGPSRDVAPTRSVEAYQAYLRGLDAVKDPTRYQEEANRTAQLMFERAIELDPGFAQAHAELSLCHSTLYHFGYDFAGERIERAGAAAETAVALAPGLGRAHLALGYYHYRRQRNYDRALEEYAAAERDLPNDSDLVSAIAYVQRRQGRIHEALTRLEQARRLSPRHALTALELASTHGLLREYDRAEALAGVAIGLAPDQARGYQVLADLVVMGTGDTRRARGILERFRAQPPAILWPELELLAGHPEEVLRWLPRLPPEKPDQTSLNPRGVLEGRCRAAAGDSAGARAAFEQARRVLVPALERHPDDFRARMDLAMACAGLGLRSEALAHARRAAAQVPIDRDHDLGSQLAAKLARVYAQVGEVDASLDEIARLLSVPAGHAMSRALLRLDPAFAPLRGHARYGALVGPEEAAAP